MILSISLRNWKSHGEKNGSYGTVINFDRGLNVIYGVNGSGKSSVAEAVAYALFGKVSSFKRVLRAGKREGEVKLLFTSGATYEVRRRFGPNGTLEAELFVLEKGKKRMVVTPKSTEVNRAIEEILGIPEELFYRAVYGAQNRLDELFEEGGVRRAKLFDEILGLEELMGIRDRLVSLRNTVERGLRLVSLGEKERELLEVKEEVRRLAEELEERRREAGVVREKRVYLEGKIEEARSERIRLEAEYRRYLELKERRSRLEGEAESLREEIVYEDVGEDEEKEYERFSSLLRDLEGIVKSIYSVERTISELRSQIESIPVYEVGDLTSLKDREKELMRKREALERSLRDALKRKEELTARRVSLERELSMISEKERRREELLRKKRELMKRIGDELSHIQGKLREIEELLLRKRGELLLSQNLRLLLRETRRCPVCGSPLTEEQRRSILENREKYSTELEREVEELERKMKDLNERKKELDRLSGVVSSIEEQISELEADISRRPDVELGLRTVYKELEAVEKEIEEMESERDVLEKELRNLREQIEEEERKQQMVIMRERLRARLEEKERELAHLRDREAAIMENTGVGSLQELKEVVEERRKRVESLRLKRKLERILDEINKLKGELSALSGIEEKFKEAEERLKNLEIEYNRLVETEKRIEEAASISQQILDEKRRKLVELEREVNRVRTLKKILTKLDKLIVAWNETIRLVREARIRAVNKALKLVWKKVYMAHYRDYTDVEFTLQETANGNYTYSLRVKTNVGGRTLWRGVEELSGGERMLALLSLRIAISYLLTGAARFLIMDEPTHNLDENLTRQLAVFLKDATSEDGLFDQIILITHDPVFSETADVVYRFDREKKGDDPTKVVRER